MHKQQNQTYEFFKEHAAEWQEKATDDNYSVIKDRHRAVQRTLSQFELGSTLLDVGCGTGQLAIDACLSGYNAVGVDFAGQMIEIAKSNARQSDVDVDFVCASIFDYSAPYLFDIISAQGFIEYISLDQLDKFFDWIFEKTASGGAIAIGSRNRLFNLATFNDYTSQERAIGAIDRLLDECIMIENSSSQSEMIENFFSVEGDLPTPQSHPQTGIAVETRHQFTPCDLTRRLQSKGYTVKAVYPINYHSMLPNTFDNTKLKNIKNFLSEIISNEYQDEHKLLVSSSSFVIEAFK